MNFYDGLYFPFVSHVQDGHSRTHVPLYYGIQFNESGTLHLRIGEERRYVLHGAYCFITHPGTKFEYEIPAGEKHHYMAVCFTGPRVEKYLESGLLDLKPEPYPIYSPSLFRETIFSLGEYRAQGKHYFAVLCLENILLQLLEQKRDIQNPAWQTQLLQTLSTQIRENPMAAWDFEREAEKMNITLRHFRRIFKQTTGVSPGHFLIRTRLEFAAGELVHTREQIRAIADKTGFYDEFYFSHLFKKYYHVSPREYRMEFSTRS